MHERSGSDARIALRPWLGNVQFSSSPRDVTSLSCSATAACSEPLAGESLSGVRLLGLALVLGGVLVG